MLEPITNLQKRFLMFLLGCIGTRLLFVYISKNINQNYLPILGWISLIPAIGFILIFLTGARESGAEVFGEKIWWNNLRPVHSLLYGLFAFNAINQNPNSWVFLLADVSFGLVSFLTHHYIQGNFSKLIN
jgi:hypothetical protein